MAGIQPEQEQGQESHTLPSGSPDANSETRGKTPATTSCNLLSWFRHPLAAFKASLKRRRSGDNNPKVERKKKVQILAGNERAEDMAIDQAAESKAQQQQKKAPASSHTDDDVYVEKEDMAIAGKEEKAKAKEQKESPENVEEPNNIDGGNNHKVAITAPNNKQPKSAPITIEEAATAHPGATAGSCWEMNQQLAAGIEDAAENAEEATPAATQDTVTAVSGIREIK